MYTTENTIDWEKIFNLYNSIKEMYSLCEETDPDLNTNLQPLNEFRAALDHVMRIIAIQNIDEYRDKSDTEESRKLYSHLRRAFFDICDMLSINYRNKIINALEPYDTDCINMALPDYYPKMRPRIEKISESISTLRTGGRFNASDKDDAIDEYCEIIKKLQEYYQQILSATSSLNEIKSKNRLHRILLTWIIPIGSVVIGAILAIIGWFV